MTGDQIHALREKNRELRASLEAAEAEADRWRERTGGAKARDEALRVEVARLRDGLQERDDLLGRLKDYALRGRGGTPDYWVGEIDALLAEDGAASMHEDLPGERFE